MDQGYSLNFNGEPQTQIKYENIVKKCNILMLKAITNSMYAGSVETTIILRHRNLGFSLVKRNLCMF